MLGDASIYAVKNKMSQEDLDELAYEIRSFLDDLEYAFQEDNGYDKDDAKATTEFYQRSWQLGRHQRLDFGTIKKGEVPYVDRSSLADAVESYLKLPIRNRSIDRMLVDALVAAEVIAYAKETLHVPTHSAWWKMLLYDRRRELSILRGLSSSPFARSHPLWQFIKDESLSFLIICVIPIGVLVALVKVFDFQSIWPLSVGLGFAGIWGLMFLIGLVRLPGFWMSERRDGRKVIDLLAAMHSVYIEIGSDNLPDGVGNIVSAKHFRERLSSTTDKGVSRTRFPWTQNWLNRSVQGGPEHDR